MPTFARNPPVSSTNYYSLLFPIPYVVLVVFNNPKGLNCMSTSVHHDLHALFSWYDEEPSLRCCVVTGAGRAFCAGADLKEWNESNASRARGQGDSRKPGPPSGFGGISRRFGKKPVIGAINGPAFGGGMEMVANMDMVVAAKSALFALTEVKRGVVALAGALPRIVRTVGRSRAMEMALTGRTVSAEEAEKWGIVNIVTEDWPASDEDVPKRPVVKKALEYAKMIADNSPDSVIISRAGVNSGWEDGSAENATRLNMEQWQKRLHNGENIHEGVRAFVEKRSPKWRDSKL